MAMMMANEDSADAESGGAGSFQTAIKRLDSDRLDKLAKLVAEEQDRRKQSGGKKSPGEMDDKAFNAWMAKQLTAGDQAMREADLRDQLGTSPRKKAKAGQS